jgi:cell division septum initiation protein DivIVA
VPGTKRALVDVTQLKELLTQLRSSLPGELEEAHEIVQRRDELINQALTESGRIRSSIEGERLERIHSTDMVQEAEDQAQLVAATATNEASEVTEEAQRQAEKIRLDAEKHAQGVRDEATRFSQERVDGANQYAQDVLFNVEQELSHLLVVARKGIETLQAQS